MKPIEYWTLNCQQFWPASQLKQLVEQKCTWLDLVWILLVSLQYVLNLKEENVVSFLFSILKPIEYWTLNCQQFCSAEDFFSCNNMCLFDIIRRTENSRCTQNLCTKGYFLFNWKLPIAQFVYLPSTRRKTKSEMNYNQTDYKIRDYKS